MKTSVHYLLKRILFVSILLPVSAFSQNNRWGLSVSNNVTALPITGMPRVFYTQCHPGIEGTRSWKMNNSEKHSWLVSANAGCYYHRFIQTLILLYPSLDYELKLNSRLAMNIGMGAGYGFSIEGSDVFKLNSDGVYEQKSVFAGRSQYVITAGLGAKYSLKKEQPDGLKITLQLQDYLQGTYINSYVPLLPINSFLVGLSLPIKSK